MSEMIGGGVRNQSDGRTHTLVQAATIGTIVNHYGGTLDHDVAELNALPPTIAHFTNRESLFASIDSVLAAPREISTPAIVVISGPPEVGRESAARHWAHTHADLFPDGSLYADLSGLTDKNLTSLSDLIASLLRQLRVPGEETGGSLTDRCDRWRRRTAGRRLLIVLVNVQLGSQVERLLPSSRDAMVLITTDRGLGSSLDKYGAVRLSIGPLDEKARAELLAKTAGPERVAAEPEAVRALLDLSEGFPGELHAVGASLRNFPGRRFSTVVSRWGSYTGGSRGKTVVRNDTYEILPENARRAYPLLGLHPAVGDRPGRVVSGVSFTLPAAAALLGVSVDEAADDLETLLDWELLREENGRYRMYGPVRQHAYEKACELPEEEQGEAVWRCVEWYLATAACADLTANPYREPVVWAYDPAQRPFGTGQEGRRRSLRWLENEHQSLCACVYAAADRGWDGLVVQLCDAQWALQLSTRPYGTLIPILELGMESARRMGDEQWTFQMAIRLGRGYFETGRFREAHNLLKEGLAAARSAGRELDEATGHEFIGRAYLDAKEYAKALRCFALAEEIEKRKGRMRGVAINLHHSARALLGLKQFQEAIEKCETAYGKFGEARNRDGEPEPDRYNQARVLMTRGRCHLEFGKAKEGGDPEQAEKGAEALLQALDIMRVENRPYQEAQILESLAGIGDEGRTRYLPQAIEIYERLGSERAELLRGGL